MSNQPGDLFFGIFERRTVGGLARIAACDTPPPHSIPDPRTGRHLHISTIQAGTRAICPSCSTHGQGGFVSFEDDLRIAFACPHCQQLVWIAGC